MTKEELEDLGFESEEHYEEFLDVLRSVGERMWSENNEGYTYHKSWEEK